MLGIEPGPPGWEATILTTRPRKLLLCIRWNIAQWLSLSIFTCIICEYFPRHNFSVCKGHSKIAKILIQNLLSSTLNLIPKTDGAVQLFNWHAKLAKQVLLRWCWTIQNHLSLTLQATTVVELHLRLLNKWEKLMLSIWLNMIKTKMPYRS